jgi:hypothetical protein
MVLMTAFCLLSLGATVSDCAVISMNPQSVESWPMREEFIANHGQFHEDVLFQTSTGTAWAWFTKERTCLQIVTVDSGRALWQSVSMAAYGADPCCRLEAAGGSHTRYSYFSGADSNTGGSITAYRQLYYRDVYKDIDLVYYFRNQWLEFDFTVKPGADPNQIAMDFSGTDSVSIGNNGDLY